MLTSLSNLQQPRGEQGKITIPFVIVIRSCFEIVIKMQHVHQSGGNCLDVRSRDALLISVALDFLRPL